MIYSLCKNRVIYVLHFYLVLFNLEESWVPAFPGINSDWDSIVQGESISFWVVAFLLLANSSHVLPLSLTATWFGWKCSWSGGVLMPVRLSFCEGRGFGKRMSMQPTGSMRPDFTVCRHCCCQEWSLTWRWHHLAEDRRAGNDDIWIKPHLKLVSLLNFQLLEPKKLFFPYLFNLVWVSFT